MERKYGKPYSKELLEIKSAFYTKNAVLLEEMNRVNEIYNRQPIRKLCKMCGEPLDQMRSFRSHNVTYYYCDHCHHVNGAHEETVDFCEKVYVEEDYGKSYHENDKIAFDKRVENIYLPKMDFLLENLDKEGISAGDIHILDVGAGSGYLVQAGLARGIDIRGVEVSEKQVTFGNRMIGKEKLVTVPVTATADYISESECNVITLIGVLEHLIDFGEVLEAIKRNERIQYIYFSVPLFSHTCIFETVFQDGYSRHMGAEHTHLFTLDSIAYMNQKYGFHEVARWQFGTDIMDLYRFLSIMLEKENAFLKEMLDRYFLPGADKLQLVLDESDFSSEVHMLIKK